MVKHPGAHKRFWQPQFGIWTILLITLVCAVIAAGGSYLLRALQSETVPRLVFIVFSLVAPMLLLVIVSACQRLLRKNTQRPKSKRIG
jgi:hypothetical protein